MIHLGQLLVWATVRKIFSLRRGLILNTVVASEAPPLKIMVNLRKKLPTEVNLLGASVMVLYPRRLLSGIIRRSPKRPSFWAKIQMSDGFRSLNWLRWASEDGPATPNPTFVPDQLLFCKTSNKPTLVPRSTVMVSVHLQPNTAR